MKTKRYKLLLLLTAVATLSLSAQEIRTSYFLERMPYRHRLNPALINEYGYVSIPVLGNIGVTTTSNMGISDFLYPSKTNSRELNLFLHPDVGVDRFLNKLNTTNRLRANVDITLLSTAFFAFGGYNVIDLSVRSQNRILVPKSLFSFLKRGAGASGTAAYDISSTRITSSSYVELGLGHARPVLENLTVGAKVKALFGAADVDARFDHMHVRLSGDEWYIRSRGEVSGSLAGASFTKDRDGYVDGLDYDSPGLGGFGLGIDLGATYEPIENLVVSAAVLDLGFISWNRTLKAVTPDTEYRFSGVPSIDQDDAFDDKMDELEDTFKEMFKLEDHGVAKSRTTMLNAAMNLGAEYKILKNKISFGLLSTTHFDRGDVWHEMMAAANFRPLTWLHLALSGSAAGYGVAWGAVLNICPRGFNFFIASDYIITEVVPKYYAPVNNATVNVNFGFNIPIGRNRLHEKK